MVALPQDDSTTASERAGVEARAVQSPEPTALSKVTSPGAEQHAARWQRSTDFNPAEPSLGARLRLTGLSGSARVWGARLGLFALGAACQHLASAVWHAPSDVAPLAHTCQSQAQCRSQVERARRAASECLLWCSEEQHRLRSILRHLHSVEERDAIRAYYAEREAREREERRRAEQALERSAEREARVQREAAEHARLELLRAHSQAQQQKQERNRALYRSYLSLLSAEERVKRLERCHASGKDCSWEVGSLLEASADVEERRQLARRNEELLEAKGNLASVEVGSVPVE